MLIGFFVSSTALGRIGAERRSRRVRTIVAKGGARDAWQVLANGGVFAAAAAAHIASPSEWWMAIGCGALATVTSDTWGTELGSLSPSQPRSILDRRPVPAGTSGGVTQWGTWASVAGALFIAGIAGAGGWPRGPILAAGVGGIAGSLADSVLGASVQVRRWCDECRGATEQSVHVCGSVTRRTGGVTWIDNDAVNFLSALLGSAAAAATLALFGVRVA